MKIAVLSGKGGTGKTIISVNLASMIEGSTYIDCDVEEPSGHLFFKPKSIQGEEITFRIPFVKEELCVGCRACVDFCKYNALAYINKLIVFEEVCHSCGGCMIFCPQEAIGEKEKKVGVILKGYSENINIITGMLNTGEQSGIPIIKKMLEHSSMDGLTWIDCPPGSSCAVMESIKNADFCILVAEPSLFGVHNLEMVSDLVKFFHKPYGVVLNKCLRGKNSAEVFCLSKGIKILGEIPFDKQLGEINSNAKISVRENKTYEKMFYSLLQSILNEVQNETTAYPQL
ncbi:MAG: 4Fe-4S binding protein [Eubacteriales bacterium]